MSGKRTLYLPDPIWEQVREASIWAGVAQRRPVSVSEYIRIALAEKFERDGFRHFLPARTENDGVE